MRVIKKKATKKKPSLKVYDVFTKDKEEPSKYRVLACSSRSAIREVTKYRKEVEGRSTPFAEVDFLVYAKEGVVLT
jgi:hypothetical protein